MIDPKLNELPANAGADLDDVDETTLTEEQRAERRRRKSLGLSIDDTIARDANLSVGARGVDSSGVTSGAGAGAGSTSLTPGEAGESPVPEVVPGATGSGTTPRGSGQKP